MNEGLLTQRAAIKGQTAQNQEFVVKKDAVLFDNVPCDLDTLAAGSRMVTAAPGAQMGQIDAVLYVVDPRLGRLPNRYFSETNWFVIDGLEYGISEIHEAINRMTGELDHFEIYVYKGRNR